MKDGGFLFPQDGPHPELVGNVRSGGATMRDFFAFAFIASGLDPEESFKEADKAIKIRNR